MVLFDNGALGGFSIQKLNTGPHLAGESQAPVPGYTTAFPMYEQVEYALPGEVPQLPVGESR